MRTITLAPHLDRLPAELHDRLLDDAMAACDGDFALRYVRLNIDAVAAAA